MPCLKARSMRLSIAPVLEVITARNFLQILIPPINFAIFASSLGSWRVGARPRQSALHAQCSIRPR
jgi:hypothetical protein